MTFSSEVRSTFSRTRSRNELCAPRGCVASSVWLLALSTMHSRFVPSGGCQRRSPVRGQGAVRVSLQLLTHAGVSASSAVGTVPPRAFGNRCFLRPCLQILQGIKLGVERLGILIYKKQLQQQPHASLLSSPPSAFPSQRSGRTGGHPASLWGPRRPRPRGCRERRVSALPLSHATAWAFEIFRFHFCAKKFRSQIQNVMILQQRKKHPASPLSQG